MDDGGIKVNLNFSSGSISVGGDSLTALLNNKSEKGHNHTILEVEGLDDTLAELKTRASNPININANGDAELTGTFYCGECVAGLHTVSEELTALNSAVFNASRTITHLTLCEYQEGEEITIGSPVYLTGKVVGKDYDYASISSTDCVPCVRSKGETTEFVGVCVENLVLVQNKFDITLDGKVYRFIKIATHGDFLFNVPDSSILRPGCFVDINGNSIPDMQVMYFGVYRTIVGIVTSIIDKNKVSVFRI